MERVFRGRVYDGKGGNGNATGLDSWKRRMMWISWFDKCRPQAFYCHVSPGDDKICLVNTHSELCMLVNSSSDILGNKAFHSYAEYYAEGVCMYIHTSSTYTQVQYIVILEPIYERHFYVRR